MSPHLIRFWVRLNLPLEVQFWSGHKPEPGHNPGTKGSCDFVLLIQNKAIDKANVSLTLSLFPSVQLVLLHLYNKNETNETQKGLNHAEEMHPLLRNFSPLRKIFKNLDVEGSTHLEK